MLAYFCVLLDVVVVLYVLTRLTVYRLPQLSKKLMTFHVTDLETHCRICLATWSIETR